MTATASSPLRVIQLTDLHLRAQPNTQLWGVDVDASLDAVLACLQTQHWPADVLLATGDLVQDEGAAAYRRLDERLAGLGLPVYVLPGNHDTPAELAAVQPARCLRPERHLRCGGWQFILLDSSQRGRSEGWLAAAELAFLEQTLAAHPDLYTLVCLHHPPVAIGSPWMDTMRVGNGEELLAVVARYPQVRALVFGHIHQAFSARRGELWLLGTPATCMQLKPGATTPAGDELPPGYRWFDLYADGTLTTGVERVAG